MAEMKSPDLTGTPSTPPAAGSPGAAGPTKGKTASKVENKGVQAAETVREKSHEVADTARSGISQVAGKVEKATDYAHKAQEFIRTAEERLDELITTAEKVLSKGTQYTGVARSWMNEHPEYRQRAERIITKATEFRDKMSSKMEERKAGMTSSGESTTEHLKAEGQEALEKGKEALERGRERLRTSATGSFGRVTEFVRENPTDTLLLGAAIGVIVGTAVKHSRDYTTDTGSVYGVQ